MIEFFMDFRNMLRDLWKIEDYIPRTKRKRTRQPPTTICIECRHHGVEFPTRSLYICLHPDVQIPGEKNPVTGEIEPDTPPLCFVINDGNCKYYEAK